MRKIIYFLVLVLASSFLFACSGISGIDILPEKIEYKSKFSDTIFTVECKMNSDWGTTKYIRPTFKTDLELSELKSKTNAELYYETDKELVFKKDDSFFVIDEIGDNFYRIHSDWAVVFYQGDYIYIPFPSFIVPEGEITDLKKEPVYEGIETTIDSKHREYLVKYFNDLQYDFIEKSGDKILIKGESLYYSYTVTVNLNDNITIGVDLYDYKEGHNSKEEYSLIECINRWNESWDEHYKEHYGESRIKILSGESNVKEEMAKFAGECYIFIYDVDYEGKTSTNFNSYTIHDTFKSYFLGISTYDHVQYTSLDFISRIVQYKENVMCYIIDYNSIKNDDEDYVYFTMHNGVEFKNIDAPMMFHYIDSESYTDMNDSKLLIADKNTNLGTWRIKILEEIQYLLKKRR